MGKIYRKGELYTIQDVAKYLSVKESRVRSAIKRKELPVIKLKRLVRFHVNDLNDWIEKSKIPATCKEVK
jgi:excisionase family DNA binding protein